MPDPVLHVTRSDAGLVGRNKNGKLGWARASLASFAKLVGDVWVAVAVHAGAPLPVYTPGGQLAASASQTRPADTTAYAIGDLIANSVTAGLVVPIELLLAARAAGEAIRIERISLRKTGPLLTNGSFRVHLFRKPPTVTVGDNGAFNAAAALALADIEGHVGFMDITLDASGIIGARGSGVLATGQAITCSSAGGAGHDTSLWALIEARAAYVPISAETFHLTIEGRRG